jgi:hypothetical protein
MTSTDADAACLGGGVWTADRRVVLKAGVAEVACFFSGRGETMKNALFDQGAAR